MGWSCSTHEGKRNFKIFCLKSLKARDHLEDLSVDGRIILKLILGEEGGSL